jgi:hypothetical protein
MNINLIQVNKTSSALDLEKTINLYRIVGIARYRHSGTMSQERFADMLPAPEGYG